MKKEIKNLIKTDNFSIVKFKRGSLTVVITLQYIILREIKKIIIFYVTHFLKILILKFKILYENSKIMNLLL